MRFSKIVAVSYTHLDVYKRQIFICSKNKKISLPSATVKNKVTVKDAIYDLAFLNSGEGDFEQNYQLSATSKYQKDMRKGCKKLYNHQASNHAKIAIQKLEMIPPEGGKEFLPKEMLGKQKYSGTWGRLKWDDVSPCLLYTSNIYLSYSLHF